MILPTSKGVTVSNNNHRREVSEGIRELGDRRPLYDERQILDPAEIVEGGFYQQMMFMDPNSAPWSGNVLQVVSFDRKCIEDDLIRVSMYNRFNRKGTPPIGMYLSDYNVVPDPLKKETKWKNRGYYLIHYNSVNDPEGLLGDTSN